MEDKTTPFNGLSPAEAERLDILAEECAEVIQAVSKIKRHGYHSRHSLGSPSNREHLLAEIGDVSAAVGLMLRAKDLPHPPTNEMIDGKLERLKKYTHHQNEISN